MKGIVRGKFTVPVDRSKVARDWKAQGYSCSLFIDPPGRQWNNFVHTCDELVVVVTGQLRMIIGDESWDIKPGDQIFIPKGASHSVHNIFSGQTQWL